MNGWTQLPYGSLWRKRQFRLWSGLLSLMLLALLLPGCSGKQPSGILEDPEHPQQVVTINPKMGVHTRLTDEVEEWKIIRTLTMVRQMGAPWITEYFPWSYIQPTKTGPLDWTHADLVVRHARANGLTIVARIDFVPPWARPKDSTARYLDKGHFADYAKFIKRFVQHFKGKITYYQIWNEPNLSFEWGERPVNAEEYTQLLRLSYQAAYTADPQVKIVSAGLAPTLENSSQGLNDLIYLQQMYTNGAGKFFDILGMHSYGWRFSPDAPPSPEAINFQRVLLERQIMVANGDAQKSALITEAGWNDNPRWRKAVRPTQRAQYTVRAYELAMQWPWLLALNIYEFRLPVTAHNFNDNWTFVKVDFTPRFVYTVVQQYASKNQASLS